VLCRGRRADAASRRTFPGGANTFILDGSLALVQRTSSGKAVEVPLVPANGKGYPLPRLGEREIDYDARTARYLVRLGGETYAAKLPEPVTAPARKLRGVDKGPVRLSFQRVQVGPRRTESVNGKDSTR